MNHFEPITIRKALSKGLLAVILLLSLFSSSNNNVYPSHQQAKKTELVVVTRASKKSFPLNKLVAHEHKKLLYHFTAFQVNTTLQAHARCIEIKFKNTSKEFLNFQKPITFMKSQNISHHSDEDD